MPTDAYLAAQLSPSPEDDTIMLLEVTLEDASVLRLARWHEDVVSNSQTYVAFPYDIVLPQQGEESPRMRITVANVDQVIGEAIGALTAPAPVTVLIVLSDDPDTVEQTFPGYEIEDGTWDHLTAEATLGQSRISTEPYPSVRVTPLLFPAIFL